MANPFEEANLFELSGGGIQVTYSTSSFTGQPLFSYRDGSTNRQFTGSEIQITATSMGRLVTVTLETIPDLRTVTFTLILSTVHVISGSAGTCFDVPGITATAHTTIAGPGPGPTITYATVNLSGTAQSVDF
jgi:hypothetical protein